MAALASWLDARAHGGHWLVRIEDVDTPRCVAGADTAILAQLAQCGMSSDAPVVWQSQRSAHYNAALDALVAAKLAYPCSCSRQDIELATQDSPRERGAAAVYPATCRAKPTQPDRPLAWRLRTDFDAVLMKNRLLVTESIDVDATDIIVNWPDRRNGFQWPSRQNITQSVGDFVLKRADQLWAYQLAVVVDDGAQGITHVIRGEDLADNTARQIWLQHALQLPTPQYWHTPLVLGHDGEKLSKQNGAQAIDTAHTAQALAHLSRAARHLGLQTSARASVAQSLHAWVQEWSLAK